MHITLDYFYNFYFRKASVLNQQKPKNNNHDSDNANYNCLHIIGCKYSEGQNPTGLYSVFQTIFCL